MELMLLLDAHSHQNKARTSTSYTAADQRKLDQFMWPKNTWHSSQKHSSKYLCSTSDSCCFKVCSIFDSLWDYRQS